jgi:hypothetical protein
MFAPKASQPPSRVAEKSKQVPQRSILAQQESRKSDVEALPELQQAAGNRTVAQLLQTDAGRPLSPATRARLEAQFGHDFSAVRIHAGPEAASAARNLSAKAFTVGSHIGFSSGRYAPDTRAGHRLLSHELAHVVQQSRRGAARPTTDGRGPMESAAQQAAARAEGGGPVPVAGASAVGVAAEPEQEESWLDRAKAGLEGASDAARGAYDDPKAAWQEVKDRAKETYSEAKDTAHEYGGKADAYATAAKQVEGGATKGLFSMVEGIGSALVHPLNTVQGLGKIANMGSLLPSIDTFKELGNFGKDVLDSSGSSKDAVKNLWKAGQDKQEAGSPQSLSMLEGIGKNYIEAAGGEIVPPVEQKTDDQT